MFAKRTFFEWSALGTLLILLYVYLISIPPPKFPHDPDPEAAKVRVEIDFSESNFLSMVRTKTEPPFYISLHREKEDIPRAELIYSGLYYERKKTNEIAVLLKSSDARMQGLFVDIGANIGWYSLYAAAIGRRVVAFEPNPANILKFRQSIAANGFKNIILKPYGAGASDAEIMFVNHKNNYGQGAFVNNDTKINPTKQLMLKVKRVDDEVQNVPSAWRRRVAVAKIDVEGFEALVLKGMMSIILKDKPLVYIELSNTKPLSDDYYQVFSEFLHAGYRIHRPREPPPLTMPELRHWFERVAHTVRIPLDYLFLPDWMDEEDIPLDDSKAL